MAEGTRPGANAGPVELWSQWYDASSRMWSSMRGGDIEPYMDPFGLYRQWFGGFEENREPPAGAASSQEMWRQWTEATTGAWRRAFGIGTTLAGLAPYWAEMAEEVRKQMFEGGRPPTDPLDFYQRWYNATSGPLSKMIREVVEDESFLAYTRRFVESQASLERVFQDASEEYFGYLQLSTSSDSSRVAQLVVGLDAKVDRVEEAFEEFEHGYAESATAEAVEALGGRMEELEKKMEDNRSDLERVESKLDQLLAALGTSTDSRAGTSGSREGGIQATEAARRKAEELDVNLQEVRGSGAGDRITVDDVRKKGEAR